jgi:hypothetical protein
VVSGAVQSTLAVIDRNTMKAVRGDNHEFMVPRVRPRARTVVGVAKLDPEPELPQFLSLEKLAVPRLRAVISKKNRRRRENSSRDAPRCGTKAAACVLPLYRLGTTSVHRGTLHTGTALAHRTSMCRPVPCGPHEPLRP